MINVAIINATQTAGLKDEQVKTCVVALQKQVSGDFAPVWGVDAKLHFYPGGDAAAGKIPKDYWWLSLLDDSDTAGALGYHDLTPQGLPLGKAFAGTDIKAGLSWTTTVSHELLEMLVDPDVNLTVLVQESSRSGILMAYEVCDACEDDSFAYVIDGTMVSDFVYPAWFESFREAKSTQFDHGERITSPFELLPGGYIGALNVGHLSGWQQITAREVSGGTSPYALSSRARVGTRRERRALQRSHWMKSNVGAKAGSAPVPSRGTITILSR